MNEEMEKFPWDGEQEMLEAEERVELGGEVRLTREVFCAWIAYGMGSPEVCLCASALMQYAVDQQSADLRGGVAGDIAWELCCRTLSQSVDAMTLGTRDLAQFFVY